MTISELEIGLCLCLTIRLSLSDAVRRLEVITGTGRRRRFSDDYKAGIVEETLVAGAVVSDVARRHGLTPQQLFSLAPASAPAGGERGYETPQFVPAVVEAPLPERRIAWTAAQASASGGSDRWQHRGGDRRRDACGSAAAPKPRR